MGAQIFKTYGIHLKVLGAKQVTWSSLYAMEPHIYCPHYWPRWPGIWGLCTPA